MVATHRQHTSEDLYTLPDVHRYELVDGDLIELPPPGESHGIIEGEVFAALREYARSSGLGRALVETSFVLSRDPDTVLTPDVSFISKERVRPLEKAASFVEGSPELAVEVLSPTNSRAEIRFKVSRYLEAGSTMVWVVDPTSRSVSVYRPGSDILVYSSEAELTGEDVLPGFRCRVAQFFE
ncbi:MAG TPA: Uma2 family endonuclease [Dehalococcoidia bacterium]|nr:Uma2 family endonuclease [Dehalococcoidia bacterium]